MLVPVAISLEMGQLKGPLKRAQTKPMGALGRLASQPPAGHARNAWLHEAGWAWPNATRRKAWPMQNGCPYLVAVMP